MLHAALAVLAALAVCQLAIVLTTVYLHRALAHRALSLSKPTALVMRALLWITTGIKPRQWVAVHRKHHAFTDEAGDPHSPVLEGFAKVQFGNVVLYRRVAKDPLTVARYARDLPADAWDRVLFDHALIGLSIGIGLLCLAFGWQIGLLAAGIHAVSYLLLSASINAIGHTYGKQPAPVTARNNQWLALITQGEGLHNHHHAAPTSARLALAAGEIDPAWWFIRPLAALGWVQIRHRDAPTAKKERTAA